MDDVDAVQAQIARNMLESGDWVTARLNGVAYLEKAPLIYWMMAASFAVFGVTDWAARIPIVLAIVLLCWFTARIGAWAFSRRAGLYAGLALTSCTGLFLFTRILIPDVVLTLAITVAMYAWLRLLEEDSPRWAMAFWASLGAGFLLKGLIAMALPAATILVFAAVRRKLEWRRLRLPWGPLVTLAIGAPWVALATLRNPPYFDFTMRSVAGEYHGFFWFFFLNEHLFRFLNMRHPRDYNTVPRLYFWLFHLLWLFPWTAYLPAVFGRNEAPGSRAARVRLLCLCWIGFLLAFFTFSTTQEYYSMPCYPALALLLGSAMDEEGPWIRRGTRLLAVIATVAAVVLFGLWFMVKDKPTPGDISAALTANPDVYTLSLGHLRDLTIDSLAYLRGPLLIAGVAFLFGSMLWRWRGERAAIGLAVMMALFTHAARWAMVGFDPYLGSRPLAEALAKSPPGEVVFDNQYYTFSSVFFYTNTRGWLLNGRVNNLEYGSYAPGAPRVFLDDAEFAQRWRGPARLYLLVEGPAMARIEKLVGRESLRLVQSSGGKYLFSNLPLLQ